MDRKLTPQQELALAKARARDQASRLDLTLAAGRRVGALLSAAPARRTATAGVVLAVLASLLALKGPLSNRWRIGRRT